MKRFWVLVTALLLAVTPAFALDAAQPEVTEEARANGVTIFRNHLAVTTEKQEIAQRVSVVVYKMFTPESPPKIFIATSG